MKLETVFVASIKRYNMNSLFQTATRKFDHYPSEEELIEFAESRADVDGRHFKFASTISVDKIYEIKHEPVAPVEDGEGTSQE